MTRGVFWFYFILLWALSAGTNNIQFNNWEDAAAWGRTLYTPTGIILLSINVVLLLGIMHLLAIRKIWVRVPVIAFHTICLSIFTVFFLLEKRPLMVRDMTILLVGVDGLLGLGMVAVKTFWSTILLSIAVAFIVSLALDYIGSRITPIWKFCWPNILFIAGYVLAIIVAPLQLDGIDVTRLMIYARIPVMTEVALKREDHLYKGPRGKPTINVATAKTPHDILIIMDESVGGTYLSINGYQVSTTPFMESKKDLFYNYGQAASSTNLSASSNIILTSGMKFDQLPDTTQLALHKPTVFNYAAHAGRENYYIDAQSMAMLNYVMLKDYGTFEYIDVTSAGRIEGDFQRDRVAVDLYVNLLNQAKGPTFTYMLKQGSHFSYSDNYPPDFLPKGLEKNNHVPEEYHKSLRWGVDGFFEYLTKRLTGRDILIVYTSDHGQSFSGSSQNMPHTTLIDPPKDQVNVPLIIWPMSEQADEKYQQLGGFRNDNFNHAWHYQVFPTLLLLMGYNSDDVKALHGGSLFDSPPAKRRFSTGYLFNASEWHTYDFD